MPPTPVGSRSSTWDVTECPGSSPIWWTQSDRDNTKEAGRGPSGRKADTGREETGGRAGSGMEEERATGHQARGASEAVRQADHASDGRWDREVPVELHPNRSIARLKALKESAGHRVSRITMLCQPSAAPNRTPRTRKNFAQWRST